MILPIFSVKEVLYKRYSQKILTNVSNQDYYLSTSICVI